MTAVKTIVPITMQMVRTAVAPRGPVETDAEVPADTRRIHLWFMGAATAAPVPAHLGLLGRITAGPSTLEFFHNTPNGEELAGCLIKHGEFRHFLSLRQPPPATPDPVGDLLGPSRGRHQGLVAPPDERLAVGHLRRPALALDTAGGGERASSKRTTTKSFS